MPHALHLSDWFRAALALGAVIPIIGCVVSSSPDTTLRARDSSVLMGAARATSRAPADDSKRISVMTANLKRCRSPRALRAMAGALRAQRPIPEIVLCQEVIFGTTSGERSSAQIVADELGYRCRGSARADGREGLAIMSRYPVTHYEALQLEARTSGLLLGFPRVSVMAEFEAPSVGRIRVVNVHLAHLPFEDHVRWEQLHETLDWIARRERAVPADLTILGGDFNATPGSSSLALLERWRSFGTLEYQDFNTSAPTMKGRRVDHIFVAGGDRPVRMAGEATLRSLRRSDHRAVIHHYEIATAPDDAARSEVVVHP